MFTGVEIDDTSLLDQTITLDITLTNVPRSYSHRYHPVQIICDYNQYPEQSSDEFGSPLPDRYIAIVYQVIS